MVNKARGVGRQCALTATIERKPYEKGLSTRKAAELLGTSTNSFQIMLRKWHGTEKQIPFWISNGCYQFDQELLLEWAARCWKRSPRAQRKRELATSDRDGAPSGLTVDGLLLTKEQRQNLIALSNRWGVTSEVTLQKLLTVPGTALGQMVDSVDGGEEVRLAIPAKALEQFKKAADFQGITVTEWLRREMTSVCKECGKPRASMQMTYWK